MQAPPPTITCANVHVTMAVIGQFHPEVSASPAHYTHTYNVHVNHEHTKLRHSELLDIQVPPTKLTRVHVQIIKALIGQLIQKLERSNIGSLQIVHAPTLLIILKNLDNKNVCSKIPFCCRCFNVKHLSSSFILNKIFCCLLNNILFYCYTIIL